MGRLRAFARKLVEAAQSMKDEANHPGVPPAHKRQENAFHKDEVPSAQAQPASAPAQPASARTGKPWYQDGDTEGWDETDPK